MSYLGYTCVVFNLTYGPISTIGKLAAVLEGKESMVKTLGYVLYQRWLENNIITRYELGEPHWWYVYDKIWDWYRSHLVRGLSLDTHNLYLTKQEFLIDYARLARIDIADDPNIITELI